MKEVIMLSALIVAGILLYVTISELMDERNDD